MSANPTPAEGVVAPLDPDFAEALIEKLTEIATRDDLKGRHVVFNTEVRSIATIVGVAAKVIGRPLAARPAAPTQSAAQTGNTRRTIIVDGLSLVDYCRANGLPYEGTQARLRRGYPLAIAISPLTGGEFRRMVRKEMER